MSTLRVRRLVPRRTFTKKYETYTSYKSPLKQDFNSRCGYCDVQDKIIGGRNTFHIDHFAPKVPYDKLKTEYSNLVYACPSCNIAKSNDWPMPSYSPSNDGKCGYVDPCGEEFDNHLARENSGEIVAKSVLGDYMRKNLKLYLKKHQVFWQFERILEIANKMKANLDILAKDDEDYPPLREKYLGILEEFHEYYNLVHNEIE